MPCHKCALPLLLALLVISACRSGLGRDFALVEKSVAGGNPALGRAAIQHYGCGSCHTINGINSANSLVGPPLTDFYKRHYIAGNLPNEAENLIRWIINPQLIEPGTAMPNLGVTEADARNIAAYLYSR